LEFINRAHNPADKQREDWVRRYKELKELRRGMCGRTWKRKIVDRVIGPRKEMIILSVDDVRRNLENSKNTEKAIETRKRKIDCIKRNKEVFKIKCSKGLYLTDRSDPQNESFLEENIGSDIENNKPSEFARIYHDKKLKKEKKIVKRNTKRQGKPKKIESDTSDEIEHFEEEQEEEMNIEEFNAKGMTESEMIDKLQMWENTMEEAELGRIPRIFMKDYKKIKVGLKKKMDELSLMFNRINVSNITGKNELEKRFIQTGYKFMTYTLQEHINNAIGKRGKKSDGLTDARDFKKKRLFNKDKSAINEDALEKNKREELAIFDRKEKAMQEFKAEIANIERVMRQQDGPMAHDTEMLDIVETEECLPNVMLIEKCMIRAASWFADVSEFVEDFEFEPTLYCMKISCTEMIEEIF
jgi:hypothetical protein